MVFGTIATISFVRRWRQNKAVVIPDPPVTDESHLIPTDKQEGQTAYYSGL